MKIRAGIVAAVALLVTLGVLVSAQLLQERPVQPPIVLSGSTSDFEWKDSAETPSLARWWFALMGSGSTHNWPAAVR